MYHWEWERMADKQGMIGARLRGQTGQVPRIGSVEPETTRKKVGKGARANTLAPVFDMSMSLSVLKGVTLPPETVTLVDFIANLSLDCNKAAYFVQEQEIGDSLDSVVIPEGAYHALGRCVRVLVANYGPDSQMLQAGQKL